MPLCHQCEWNERPPDDAKRAACLACPGPSENLTHKGRIHVSMDAGGVQTAAAVEAALQKRAQEAAEDADDGIALPDCCRRAVFTLLDYLCQLDERQLKILLEVAQGHSLAEIARSGTVQVQGCADGGSRPCTRALMSHDWRKIVKRLPELEAVLKPTAARR